jgi:iron complex transport system ATP-binding protein
MIKVNSLNFNYTPQRSLLNNLNFEIAAGEFIAIAGPNGAGKTTLINLLCGLLKPHAGSIHIDGKNINSYSVKDLAKKAAVVRQEFVPVFDFTVAEIISMARTPYLHTLGFETKFDIEIINEALEMTQTTQFASRPMAQLSGGERQRVFIARALAQDTPILLLDEPTNFLDLKHQVAIFDLLKKMQLEKGKTIVAITHDINLAVQYCDKALLLAADGLYHYGKISEIFTIEQIEKIFGVITVEAAAAGQNFFLPVGKFGKNSDIPAKPR